VADMSYNYLYLHDLYPAVSDICFMISLHSCSMLFMIRQLALEHRYPFQHSNVCSSMMYVHPKVVVSARDTRVSLINANMVSGLIQCACGFIRGLRNTSPHLAFTGVAA